MHKYLMSDPIRPISPYGSGVQRAQSWISNFSRKALMSAQELDLGLLLLLEFHLCSYTTFMVFPLFLFILNFWFVPRMLCIHL